MISDNHSLSGHDSADALAAYLVRVDIQLARTGLGLNSSLYYYLPLKPAMNLSDT